MNSSATGTVGGLIVLALIVGSALLFLSFYSRYKKMVRRGQEKDDSAR